MRHLYLMRHADAELPGDATDLDRPLTEQGVDEAGLIAHHMIAARIAPELVWCSPATRTRETLQALTPALGVELEVRFDDRIYNAPARDLVAVVMETPDSVGDVLLVAHNPGIHQFAVSLAGEGESGAPLIAAFPPAGLAAFAIDCAWSELAPGNALLETITLPERPR